VATHTGPHDDSALWTSMNSPYKQPGNKGIWTRTNSLSLKCYEYATIISGSLFKL